MPYYIQEEDRTTISPAGAPSSAQPQMRVFSPTAGTRQGRCSHIQNPVGRNPYWSCAVEALPLGTCVSYALMHSGSHVTAAPKFTFGSLGPCVPFAPEMALIIDFLKTKSSQILIGKLQKHG